MKPLKHQERFAHDYEGKKILVHETGTGKTICACLWLKDGRDQDPLIVCINKTKKKWQRELKKWGTKGTVLTENEFKTSTLKQYSAIVFDEADRLASPLFSNKCSQISAKAYNLIKLYPAPRLLLTATPVRSSPWNFHTILCISGIYIDHKKWRDHFFDLEKRAYVPRPAYFPKSNWRELLRPIMLKYCDIVNLKDCVGEVPRVEHITVKVTKPKFIKKEWKSPASFYEEHRNEQKTKYKDILQIGLNYRKVLVVAYYREDCQQLQKELSKDRETYMVMGGVNDQEEILNKVNNEVDDCYLIVQAGMGVGWDADSFSCVIFCSMSYAVRDYVQLLGRVRRIHNLHPVRYYYLTAGRCDEAIRNNVELGKEFVPSQWNG